MAVTATQCPHCGKTIRADDSLRQFYCIYCGHTVESAAVSGGDMLAYDQKLVQTGYQLLGTPPDDPAYEIHLREAEGNFNGALKIRRENHLAWTGLFICYLRLTEITYQNQPRIEDSPYWLTPNIPHSEGYFQVESLFCRVTSYRGHANAVVVDDILQPGRKAKLYLENALRFAPEDETDALEDIRFTYFGKPLEEMARIGLGEVRRRQSI